MFRRTPDGDPVPETPEYKSQTVSLKPKFEFSQTFYEVEPGVIEVAQKLAERLNDGTPSDLERDSKLKAQYSSLALLSQKVARARTEAGKNSQTGNEEIKNVMEQVIPGITMRQAWKDRKQH